MAKNKLYKYIGAIALGVAVMAVPSCSDDHFDIYEGGDNQSVATKTLWELISENPNLTKFKTIAENARFWKDEKHPVDNWTYADVLKSGQLATVWAPEDADFPDEEYQKWLDMCKTNGYNVQQQFLGNHIALWRNHVSNSSIDTTKMINGKNLVFDKSDTSVCTIQGISLGEKNIAALNGTLHTIKGITPFRYNFYEYLKFSKPELYISKYVVSKDTTEFYKDASIEGLPDKEGRPSYVDSVYRTSNILFENYSYIHPSGTDTWDVPQKCFHARINVEDSAFIMIVPTDEAWEKAKQKLAPLYKYPQKYEDKIKSNKGQGRNVREIKNPDSLANMCMEMDLTTPLVFNIHKQPKVGSNLWTLEEFAENKGATAKYLLNTYGDTLRSTDTWDMTSIFDGNLIKMSNGYMYEVNELKFPREIYNPDIEVEINWGPFYNTTNPDAYKIGAETRTYTFNTNLFSDIANKYGHVSYNNFFFIAPPSAQTNPHVEIPLRGNLPSTSPIVKRGLDADVMSGTYDIKIVMVPYWYTTIANQGTDTLFFKDGEFKQDYIDEISSKTKMSIRAKLSYCDDQKSGADKTTSWTKVLEYDGSKVDTITLMEDFKFPCSYKNMIYSYPVLIIEGVTKTSGNQTPKKGFMYGLNIDRIILKSKETGFETILDAQ